MHTFIFLTLWAFVASCVSGLTMDRAFLEERQTGNRLVFAHIIVGITSNRNSAADWDADMKRAKAYGIDAFALNIGTDSFTDTQLNYAYSSAANNGMKAFLSFDFAWWSTSNANGVGQKISQYAKQSAQLIVDNKVFVSSFVGDGVDVSAVRNAAGTPIYFAPNFHPGWGTSLSGVDGALNWAAWPSNGNNRAPTSTSNVTVQSGDDQYVKALSGKGYIAPASPWFFTHYGTEVSYSKNWLFPAELLWYQRWNQLLTLGPRFVEIISWNDYGESHYVGPLASPHTDDGASKWVNDMPHGGWLDMAKPFIAAFKAGSTSVNNYIASDQLIYWYRPQPTNVNCDATDTCMGSSSNPDYYVGRPNGYQTVSDSVFVVSLLKSAGTVQVTSGGTAKSFNAPAGANAYTVPLGIGQQKFTLTRNSQTVLSATSPKDIINGCVCGLYNFNAYVGTVPQGATDTLSGNGYDNFSKGLKVTTCKPTPSATARSGTTDFSDSTESSVSSDSSSPSNSLNPSIPSNPSAATVLTPDSLTASLVCQAGSGDGNYAGLCSFSCSFGYCPAGPCTCTTTGAPKATPASTGTKGVPADGLDASYSGLCSFACDKGYCPSSACKVEQ